MLVIAEVAYLVSTRLGPAAEVRFVGDLASGALIPLAVEPVDWERIAELVARYRDLPLGTVDASVVAAAERLGVTTIATLDRRHFGVVRPAHTDAFELLPPDTRRPWPPDGSGRGRPSHVGHGRIEIGKRASTTRDDGQTRTTLRPATST
jgi:uncharacterized protein